MPKITTQKIKPWKLFSNTDDLYAKIYSKIVKIVKNGYFSAQAF